MEFTKNCQKSALRVLAETIFFITLSIFTQNSRWICSNASDAKPSLFVVNRTYVFSVFAIERPLDWICQNYMTSQFRMFQTMLRFVRLLYFLQHQEADMRKAVIFLDSQLTVQWPKSEKQTIFPYHDFPRNTRKTLYPQNKLIYPEKETFFFTSNGRLVHCIPNR